VLASIGGFAFNADMDRRFDRLVDGYALPLSQWTGTDVRLSHSARSEHAERLDDDPVSVEKSTGPVARLERRTRCRPSA
jgi:hypothetical protein